MSSTSDHVRLARPVDPDTDHVLGPADAEITLVEYGSYACPHCRAAHDRLVELRHQFGDRLRYVFRHRPVTGNPMATAAAELVEQAETQDAFWKAHVALMSGSANLRQEDLDQVARDLGPVSDAAAANAARRVAEDVASANASGVTFTPTFFINGRRYDGPWDDVSFSDALLGSLGHRVRAAALDFADWSPSSGVVLLLATILAVVLSNSALSGDFAALWTQSVGLTWGGGSFTLPLLKWVNDGLLTIFFLVVGLEIKREFTVGHLANRRLAALPVAAAIGGMVAPALIYILLIPDGPWSHGWGIPIATDTAFAVALIAMMGARVPIELRIFLTAAAIVDDIAAIAVVALFYSDSIHVGYLAAALVVLGLLFALNRAGVYRVLPYTLLGLVLWVLIHEGGVHATLAGVLLAMFIPTRSPPNYHALMVQSDALVAAEMQRDGEQMRHGLSAPTMQALDAIHDRLESPAARVLRIVEVRSSYVVLPIFAFANAGVTLVPGLLDGRGPLVTAIVAGLVVGKPLGLLAAAFLSVRMGLAVKPTEYSWLQLAGAGCLAGIGFTMSLFIAGQAFPLAADFDAAKVAIFAASLLSATFGVGALWWAGRPLRITR